MEYATSSREYSKRVGENLRRLRLARHLTQAQVAHRTGLREAIICQIENPGNAARNGKTGVKAVTVDQLMALANGLACPITEFFKR